MAEWAGFNNWFISPTYWLIILQLKACHCILVSMVTELHSRSQQKEALQLLCLLLPRPNRDTLQELVQFLSRVALHSNDTILLDGTEVCNHGNRVSLIRPLFTIHMCPIALITTLAVQRDNGYTTCCYTLPLLSLSPPPLSPLLGSW